MMARKIWQGEFARFWFGPRAAPPDPPRKPPKKVRKPAPDPKPAEAGRPLGIVEAHRRALREKRVLKPQS